MKSIALAFVLVLASCQPVMAQQTPACGSLGDIAERLAAGYQETAVARGVDAAGNLVIFYTNADTGTWTVLVARPRGPACVAGSGEGWEPAPPTQGRQS